MDKYNLVVKENSLNEMVHNLKLIEYKFVIVCISKLKKEDTEFPELEISIKEFSELLNIRSNNLYNKIKKEMMELSSKVFGIKNLLKGDFI